MIRFFAKRKNRKGFTLTELIVVVALMAIIMACVVTFGSPVRTVVKNASAKNDTLTINNIICNYIERQLSFANAVDIYIGYDYDTALDPSKTDSTIQKKFEDYKSKKNADNYPAVMVLHFQEKTGDSTSNTFKVYNYQITDASTAALPATKEDLEANCAVFDDTFYANHEYFITTDDMAPGINSSLKAYLNFSVTGYEMDESTGITEDDVKSHYIMLNGGAPDAFSTDTDFRFSSSKLSSDNVSFAIENLKGKKELKEDKDMSNNVIGYHTETTDPPVGLTRNVDTDTYFGTDIFIFYNIRHFNYPETP